MKARFALQTKILLLVLGLCGPIAQAQAPQFKSGIDPALLRKADAGNSGAEFLIGVAYDDGKGVVRDAARAASWYEKAADRGDARAQHNLGALYEYGDGVPQDYARAAGLYRKSAEQGLASSQFSLALCYAHGNGVSQDFAQALAWYQKAAGQGFTPALLNLALMYRKGQGVLMDEPRASQLIRQAADLGDPTAQLQVAMDYEDGANGMPQDLSIAKDWLRKAAEQGSVAAEFDLAVLMSSEPREMYYWLGLVVPHLKGSDLDRTVELRKHASARLQPQERDEIDGRVRARLREQAGGMPPTAR